MLEYAETLRELAREIGVTQATLNTRRHFGDAPEKSEKGYDVEAWLRFVAKHSRPKKQKELLAKLEKAKDPAEPKHIDPATRKIIADAEWKELRVAKEKGELIEVGEVQELLAGLVGSAITELRRLESTLPAKMSGLNEIQCQKVISESLDNILDRMRKKADQWAQQKEGDESKRKD